MLMNYGRFKKETKQMQNKTAHGGLILRATERASVAFLMSSYSAQPLERFSPTDEGKERLLLRGLHRFSGCRGAPAFLSIPFKRC